MDNKEKELSEMDIRHTGIWFEKVSFDQFVKDMCDKNGYPDNEEVRVALQELYDRIKLPRRGTSGSAGYDFYMPYNLSLSPGRTYTIPTGIRCHMPYGIVLMCYPRSGLGFKYGMRLRNSTGIIDSDYAFADNEGHIMACMTVDEECNLDIADRFMQGVFLPYFIVDGDEPIKQERHGGIGSTGGC